MRDSIPSVLRDARGLLAGALMIMSPLAWAVQIDIMPSQTSATVGDALTVGVSISGITSPGVILLHADLFWNTSVLSLTGAQAGDFFDLNFGAGAGSIWTDGFDLSLAAGDAVDTTAIDITTGPDVIGLDFLETNLVASLVDGTLVTLTFDVVGVGAAGLAANDLLIFDNFFNESTLFTITSDVDVTAAQAVPGPATGLLLAGALLIAAGRARRR